MCIKIIRADNEVKYDISIPLEDQIKGSKQIVVDYEPNDPSLGKFLGEIERFCKTGINRNLNIKVKHNNSVMGSKIRSRMKEFANDLNLNEIIRFLSLTYSETDKKLEELANMCNSQGK